LLGKKHPHNIFGGFEPEQTEKIGKGLFFLLPKMGGERQVRSRGKERETSILGKRKGLVNIPHGGRSQQREISTVSNQTFSYAGSQKNEGKKRERSTT